MTSEVWSRSTDTDHDALDTRHHASPPAGPNGPYRSSWVVLPTFNEADNVVPVVRSIERTLPGCTILIVDDGSPDGTADIAEALVADDVTVIVHRRPRKQGLGAAYLEGFERAIRGGASVVIHMDADGSHDAAVLPRLVGLLHVSDLAIGSRYVEGGRIIGWPLHRRLLSKAANVYARRVLGVRTRDVTSGFRAWRTPGLTGIDLRCVSGTGYAFLTEMLFLASRADLLISETPIVFRDRQFGESKMSNREVSAGALFLLRVRLRNSWMDATPASRPVRYPVVQKQLS